MRDMVHDPKTLRRGSGVGKVGLVGIFRALGSTPFDTAEPQTSAPSFSRAKELRGFAILLAVIVVVPLLGMAVVGGRAIGLWNLEAQSKQSETASQALQDLGDRAHKAIDLTVSRVEERIDEAVARGSRGHLAIVDQSVDLAIVYAEHGRRMFRAADVWVVTPFERRLAQSTFAPLDMARGMLVMRLAETGDRSDLWTVVGTPVGLNPARCWHERDQTVACVVFEKAAITGSVVNALRAFPGHSADIGYTLYDEAGAALWQSAKAPVGTVLASQTLLAPWSAWRLEARRISPVPDAGPSWVVFGGLMAAMLAVIGSMAGYIFLSQRSRLEAMHHRAAEAAQVSHELRTPLTNLGLYGDLIRARAKGDETITEYCDVLDAETKRLGALVEDATALARGRLRNRLQIDVGNPDDAARHLLSRYQPVLDKGGGRITLQPKANTVVRYDRTAFERILINFLDNARKYAPDTPIIVATWMNGDMLYLSVRDHGPGVPPHLAEAIFAPSVRGDRGPEGHGLGLALCRRLARNNGGDVIVKDGSPGAYFVASLRTEPGSDSAGE